MDNTDVFLNCSVLYGHHGYNMTKLKSFGSPGNEPYKLFTYIAIVLAVIANITIQCTYFKIRSAKLISKTFSRLVVLLILVFISPIVSLLLSLALCYKLICTLVIWKKDKYFVGLLDSFDIFWSLEDEATINVLGVIESSSPETLVDNIRFKLKSIMTKAGVDKIFFRRYEKYGFYYWRKYNSVDICQYVELLDVPVKSILTRMDLENILSEVSYQSLPYDNEGLFKIFVTKQRVGNYNEKKGEYGIIFIIHHSVGDGVALLEFLCKTLADNVDNESVSMFSIPEPKNYDSPQEILDMIKKLVEVPVCFVDSILRQPDNNTLHGPPLLGVRSFKWTESDEDLLKMIKEIKDNLDNVTFSDVLATALSGGMHDYFTQTKRHVPEDLGVILPVRFPKRACDIKDHGFLFKNDFSVTILTLPIRGRGNLKMIKQRCDDLRKSADPLFNHYFIKLVSILPKQLLQPMLKSSQATLVFSNMPGPDLQTICGGNALKKLVFFVPHKGNTGIDVTSLCYGGVLRLAVSADKSLVCDPDNLSYILDGMIMETVNEMAIPEASA